MFHVKHFDDLQKKMFHVKQFVDLRNNPPPIPLARD